jgi:hypothetical protein
MKNLTQKTVQSTSSKDFFDDRAVDVKQLDQRTLTPESETAKKFVKPFSYGYMSIYKPVGSKNWFTETRHELSPRDLWREHQLTKRAIGVRFGAETTYVMLDVDIDSPHHPYNDEKGLTSIKGAMESIGLVRSVDIRSSHSEGLHLFYPLPKSVSTYSLACAVGYALEQTGLTIKQGTLETFPNRKNYGTKEAPVEYNGHRLPLQPESGSYLLDENLAPYSDSIEALVILWEQAAAAQDIKQLEKSLTTAPRQRSTEFSQSTNDRMSFKDFSDSILATWHLGFTDFHQTHKLILPFAIKYYVLDCITDREELAAAIENGIRSARGYHQYCRDKREVKGLAQRNAKYVIEARKPNGKPRYFPHTNRCVRQSQEIDQPVTAREKQLTAVERIKLALEQIGDRVFDTVREAIAAIRAIAKCSPSTLYREGIKELWKHLTNCNKAYSNDCSDLDVDYCTANANLENAESITQSLVTVPSTIDGWRDEILPSRKINDPVISGMPAASIFCEQSSEPIQANDFQPIMTPDQQLAIARTCPSPPMPESANRRSPKEPPRPNPSTLENIQAIVTADPSKAGSQLAMLQAKLFLPWLKSEERSQTEAAIAWLKKLLECDRTRMQLEPL